MPWVRFEDDYLGSKKLATLPVRAIAMDMAGIIYSARELRDGRLTLKDVQTIAVMIGVHDWRRTARRLCQATRWLDLGDDGFEIHDYLHYQPTAESVIAQRDADRERKQEARRARMNTRKSAGRRQAPAPVSDPPKNGMTPHHPRRGRGLSEQDERDLAAHQARAVRLAPVPEPVA